MRRVWVPFFILFMAVSGCSKKSSTGPTVRAVEDLLLKDNEISGWSRAGSGWVANNDQELFQFINGAAPDYIQNGFVEGAGQEYSGKVLQDTCTIILYVFNVGQAANASALLNVMKDKMVSPETWSSDAFEAASIDRSAQAQKIIGTASKYFISVSVTSGLNEALEVAKMFAANVGTKIE